MHIAYESGVQKDARIILISILKKSKVIGWAILHQETYFNIHLRIHNWHKVRCYSWTDDVWRNRIPVRNQISLQKQLQAVQSCDVNVTPIDTAAPIYTWMGRYLKSCLHQEWLERLKAVKTVSDKPGACLDKPAVREQNHLPLMIMSREGAAPNRWRQQPHIAHTVHLNNYTWLTTLWRKFRIDFGVCLFFMERNQRKHLFWG